jgi:hypothetical protein
VLDALAGAYKILHIFFTHGTYCEYYTPYQTNKNIRKENSNVVNRHGLSAYDFRVRRVVTKPTLPTLSLF